MHALTLGVAGAWLIPALVGIGLIAVYLVVIGFAEFVWRFAQAGIRNEFDDYKEAEMLVSLMTAPELAAWMSEYGYTYRSLAAALGVARSTIERWRAGASPIPKTAALAMAYLASKSDH